MSFLKTYFYFVLFLPFIFAADSLSVEQMDDILKLESVVVREDRYPIPIEQWQWVEGWGEIRQFFPDFYKPMVTIHLFIRNDSDTEVTLSKVVYDGKPIDQVCTKVDSLGPVLWYRIHSSVLSSGAIGEVCIRMRERPANPVNLKVCTKDGVSVSTDLTLGNSSNDDLRFGYVGFNADINRVYAYITKYVDYDINLKSVYLDGVEVTLCSEFVNPNFDGGPALIEIKLVDGLDYGSYHNLKVCSKEGPSTMCQFRARDNKFLIGMLEGQDTLDDYYAKFFNCIYYINSPLPSKPDWWFANEEFEKLDFTVIRQGRTKESVEASANIPAGKIIYTGIDEPDAHEPGRLPYMKRSGINVMKNVEPKMSIQRDLDPNHLTAVLVDRTYAPMNWFNYGEVPDLLINDCYVPTQFMGYDLEVLPNTVEVVTSAAAPRPVHMVLWGCMNTGYSIRRSPTPEENDISVHYVLAQGAKGIHYFLDWNSYPKVFEGGYFIGASRTNMLWHNIGRMNAEVTRLAPILSKGFPYQIAKSDTDDLYVASLLCGKENFVIFLINRKHRVYETSNYVKPQYIYPVDNATVEIKLPSWFKAKTALSVAYDGVSPVTFSEGSSQDIKKLKVSDLLTSRVIVVSSNQDVAKELELPQDRFCKLLESEKPKYADKSVMVKDFEKADSIIHCEKHKKSLTIDLTSQEVLNSAASIKTIGDLCIKPRKWLGLFPKDGSFGESEIIYVIETDHQIGDAEAVLYGETPNFAACANNAIAVSFDGKNYTQDCSFKMDWSGGVDGEFLKAKITVPENVKTKHFYVRVLLRDPGYVKSTGATNIARKISVSWTNQ